MLLSIQPAVWWMSQDLLRLLLVGKENAGTRRTRSYSLELTPEIYQYCFDARPWDTRAWCSQAVRCWRLLCQRGAARKSVECVASLESMRGHEPAMVREMACIQAVVLLLLMTVCPC